MAATGILYVGTRDGLAIYRPAEGGRAWQRTGHTLAGSAIATIMALDAQTLLVAVDNQPAQQSFDGGATWSPASSPPPPIGLQVATLQGLTSLAYPRLSGATAYARLSGKPSILIGAAAAGTMLFWSQDDGIHWAPAAMPREPIGSITSIVPATESRGAAWAGTSTGALLRTNDRSQSWQVAAHEAAAILSLAAVPATGS
jgi:photosystem II stability/assembly factor-like uncharacterized protein